MTPEEQLDEARAEEAVREMEERNTRFSFLEAATIAARKAREGWTPPVPAPVHPDVEAYWRWHKSVNPTGRLILNVADAYLAGARMAREQERERAKVLVECVERYAGPHAAMAIAKYRGEA